MTECNEARGSGREIVLKTKEQQDKITHKIIGCAMEVHNTLGLGFQEMIYGRCLSIELNLCNIEHQKEVEIPISYKGCQVGFCKADFLVMNEILVEIKALAEIEDSHFVQAMNYLESSGFPTGLLINFGARSLQFKRLFNKSGHSVNH